MPTRQLKYKVGSQILETKQAAVEYAAEHGGIPEKIVVEIDAFVQADPPVTPEVDPVLVSSTPEGDEEAKTRKGTSRLRKS